MRQNVKKVSILLVLALCSLLIVSCRTTPKPSPTNTVTPLPTITTSPLPTVTVSPSPTGTISPTATADVKTSASIVDNAAAFEKAISNKGTWIIAVLNDLNINKELILDGEFKNGKKDDAGKDIIQRKIALYTQDADRKVTARFTLTAPKLTINSLNARIQSGTFKGDVYVNAKNFQLVDATVEGNVYFTNNDAKSTFKMDATSKITGKQELKK